jgi:hypothetical protein
MLRAAATAPKATAATTISQMDPRMKRRRRLALGVISSRASMGIDVELSAVIAVNRSGRPTRRLLRFVKTWQAKGHAQARVRVFGHQRSVMEVDGSLRDGQPETNPARRGVARLVHPEKRLRQMR